MRVRCTDHGGQTDWNLSEENIGGQKGNNWCHCTVNQEGKEGGISTFYKTWTRKREISVNLRMLDSKKLRKGGKSRFDKDGCEVVNVPAYSFVVDENQTFKVIWYILENIIACFDKLNNFKIMQLNDIKFLTFFKRCVFSTTSQITWNNTDWNILLMITFLAININI